MIKYHCVCGLSFIYEPSYNRHRNENKCENLVFPKLKVATHPLLKRFQPGDLVEILENDVANESFSLMRNGQKEIWSYAEFANGCGVDIDIIPAGESATKS